MALHQSNKHNIDDSTYLSGSLKYLVKNNHCVLLDGRRTPGIIEDIDTDSGMFIWRILDFEDKGRYWELPFEDVKKYLFEQDAKSNTKDIIEQYEQIIKEKQQMLHSKINPIKQIKTYKDIEHIKKDIIKWFETNSLYFKSHQMIDMSSNKGHNLLYKDLQNYMTLQDLWYLEEEVSDTFCLNPSSGELIKGMMICLSEMGLVAYKGTTTRKKETFEGKYTKATRKKYLKHRLAFVQAMFEHINIHELIVYRGMTSEKALQSLNRSLLSTTMNLETAEEFFDASSNPKIKSSYLMKLSFPISHIFMTYLETKQLNKQYLEQEVIVLNTAQLPI